MKMYLSAFLPILLLAALVGCSKEQFGSVPQTENSTIDGLKYTEDNSCSKFTLVKPKVDILYVVDNSTSTLFLGSSIKASIKQTLDTISTQFDYRVIGIPLLSSSNSNYQVLTNSSDLGGIPADSRRVQSSNDFTFFSQTANGTEKGMSRTYNFINSNKSTASVDNLFRRDGHLIVILISNGRDSETEQTFGNGSTQSTAAYTTQLNNLSSLKNSMNLVQFRFFTITAKTQRAGGLACEEGWVTAFNSYVKASNALYVLSGATDSSVQDSYDLCQSSQLTNIYAGVNNSIKQYLIPHKYKYFPITFADDAYTDFAVLKVYKYAPNAAPVEISNGGGSVWSHYQNPNYPAGLNTRVSPSVGEPVEAKHFIEFKAGNEITYPDCVIIKSSTKIEYYQYFALARPAVEASIVVRKNGISVPKSTTDGWSYEGGPLTMNIKADGANPPVVKSGFMIKFNGSNNYYQSGDNVEVVYTSGGI
jgi:hypothetical protein